MLPLCPKRTQAVIPSKFVKISRKKLKLLLYQLQDLSFHEFLNFLHTYISSGRMTSYTTQSSDSGGFLATRMATAYSQRPALPLVEFRT
mmetsp:Transcript_19756/g.23712  ORF Transcript_19756/g.23712 Transcript_19756/m.23712 type:complete len:89 (+) Transcript_19756:306-572(+)